MFNISHYCDDCGNKMSCKCKDESPSAIASMYHTTMDRLRSHSTMTENAAIRIHNYVCEIQEKSDRLRDGGQQAEINELTTAVLLDRARQTQLENTVANLQQRLSGTQDALSNARAEAKSYQDLARAEMNKAIYRESAARKLEQLSEMINDLAHEVN